MTSPIRCGCYFTLPSGREACLPLQSVSAQVDIADVLARVTLTQYFANTNRTNAPATAKYIFPVPVGGAVCTFEMHTADGKVVVGEVKESRQAEAEFREAVSQNKTAGLLAKAAPDVFVMSLGAIPPKQAIKTIITYVIELADDELVKQVRFSLPTYVGMRYGTPPSAIQNQATQYARFTLSADIQMTSAIEQVVSSSHAVKVTGQDNTGATYHRRVQLDPSSDAFLDKDFVLSIKANKVDAPRCVAEVLPNKPSVALSLTLVPRFGVKPIDSQEYIFLIDRSGSMNEQNKIDYAKNALLIMLKSLPSNGTKFNIFSFGSSYSSLWPTSQGYAQATLSTAVRHVDSMGADMGGTEIASALDCVISSRVISQPTSIFVLTDGEVWDVDSLLDGLRTSVSAAGSSSSGSYLRVFTLGVGYHASTALCSGLARAGNGLCLMTTQSEDLAGKCTRLLRASLVPPSGNLRNVRVDWGYAGPDPCLEADTAKAKQKPPKRVEPAAVVNLFDEEHDPLAPREDTGFPVELRAAADVQQAPSVVPDFYPGSRFVVSAILSKTTTVPQNVVLRGETPDGQAAEFVIPVHAASFQKPWPPLVHTLAAHRIIQELEDGYIECLGLTANVDPGRTEEIASSAIVRYSTEYQVASKYASFIAVEKEKTEDMSADEDSDFEIIGKPDIDPEDWIDDFEASFDSEKTLVSQDVYRPSRAAYSRALHIAEQEQEREEASRSHYEPPTVATRARMSLAAAPLSMPTLRAPAPHIHPCAISTAAHYALQQAAPASVGMGCAQSLLPQSLEVMLPQTRSLASRRSLKSAHRSPEQQHSGRLAPSDDPATAIARLQSFDGSFTLDNAIVELVFGDKLTLDVVRNATPVSIRAHPQGQQIWATAIAFAYLKTKAGDTMGIWAGLWEKANGYAGQVLRDDTMSFDQLVEEAISLL